MCRTVHRLSMTTGDSLVVNKHCVEPRQCTMQHVGCRSVFYSTDTFVRHLHSLRTLDASPRVVATGHIRYQLRVS